MAERPLYTLYKNLKAQNFDVPNDYDKFENALTRDGKAGADNRHAIYQNLKAQNFDVPDTYERFYSALFEPRSKDSSRAKGGSVPMSEADKTKFIVGARNIAYQGQQSVRNAGRYSKLKERKRKQQKDFGRVNVGTHKTVYGGDANNVLKDDATGQYVTSDNDVTYDIDEAQQKQAALDEYGKAWNEAVRSGAVPSAIDEADPNLTPIDIEKRQADREADYIESLFAPYIDKTEKTSKNPFYDLNRGGVGGLTRNAATGNGLLADEKARQLIAARNQNAQRRRLLDLEQDTQNGSTWNNHSFWRGFSDALKDINFWTGGVSSMFDAGSLLGTKQDLDNGKRTTVGDVLLQASVNNAETQSKYGDDSSWVYDGGMITANMLPFIAQIAGAGFSEAATQGIGKVVQGVSSGAAKVAMKKAAGVVGVNAAKNIGKMTGLTTKAFGKALQYGIIGAAQANTLGFGNVAADVMGRYTGQIYQGKDGSYKFGTFDSDGNLVHEGGEDFLTSLVKGELAQTTEFATELAGGSIDAVGRFLAKGGKNILDKFGMQNVTKYISALFDNRVTRAVDRTLGKVEVNSIVGESMEEELGIIANSIFTGDNQLSDLWDKKQQAQIWGGMFLSIGLMKATLVPFHAYNAAQYYRYKHKVDVADANLSQVLGKDKWEGLRDRIDATSNEEMPKMLLEVLRDESLGGNRAQVGTYIKNLLTMRGYNIGTMLNAQSTAEDKGQNIAATDMAQNQAYQQGHEAEGTNTHEIQIDNADKQKSLAQLLGVTEQQVAAMSNDELESLTGQDDNLDRAIYEYQLSNARYQGVIDNAQDKVDLAVQQASQAVDMYTDKSRGTVRNATIKGTQGANDYGVYIINGNVATHDDGSIDISGSDKMIIYFDPQTGKVEHADASRFAALGDENPADEVKTQAMADAKENAIKEQSGIIDGRVDVGTQFNVTDENGVQHTYEVLADNGDGTAMITLDGNVEQNPYSFEDLQNLKDMEDQKLLEAAKAQRKQMEAQREQQKAEQQKQEEEKQKQLSQILSDIIDDNGNVVIAAVEGNEDADSFVVGEYNNKKTGVKKYKVVTLNADGTVSSPRLVDSSKVKIIDTMSADEYKENMDVPDSSDVVDNSGEDNVSENTQLDNLGLPKGSEIWLSGDGIGRPKENTQSKVVGIDEQGNIILEDKDGSQWSASFEYVNNHRELPPLDENTNIVNDENNQTESNNATLTFEDGSPVPMTTDSKGRPAPDYDNMTAEQSAEVLQKQFGEGAEKVADARIKKAEKAVEDAEKMKVDYSGEDADIIEQEKKKAAAIAAAQDRLEKAQAIKKAMTAKKVAETMAKPKETKVESAHEAGKEAVEKFQNSKRLKGNHVTKRLPTNEKISGHYEIVPAESLTPSHDASNGYKKSEGFPVDEEGRTINDRDYEHDKAAQQTTDQMAQKYSGQAITNVPTVSDEGIVYDGNGRTMAGQKAAKNGTDAEYIEDLMDNAENYGFTREQIEQSGIEHPRLVMVTDERLPYDTATFSKFNRNEKKTQSNTEQAVAKAKTLTPDEVGAIVSEIEGNGSLDAFFNNSKSVNDLVKTLQSKGVLGQNEVAGYMEDNGRLNAQGREFVKNLLLGAVFKPETIRMLGVEPSLKNKAIAGIRSIMDNMKLGDYSLRDEIDHAIQLMYEAKKANSKNVAEHMRTSDLEGSPRERYTPMEQAIAQALDGSASLFRDLIEEYNNIAKTEKGTGEAEMFGARLTPEEVNKAFLDVSKTIKDNDIKLYANEESGNREKEGNNHAASNEESSKEAGGKTKFSAKEGPLETPEERAANVEKNKVESTDVVDAIIGKKMRKSLDRIAKMMGAKIQYQYTDKKNNGWYDASTNTIYIALDSSIIEGVQFVFGHEMTHEIKDKNPAAFEELKNLVKNSMGEDVFNAETDKMQERYKKGGASYWNDRDAIEEEVVADQLGYMMRDLNYAHTLALKMSHPLLAKLHEIINRIRMAFYGTEYTEQAKQMMRSIERAYVATANREANNTATQEGEEGQRLSLRTKEAPKKTQKVYKLMRLNPAEEGKLFPLFIGNGEAVELGKWYDADSPKLQDLTSLSSKDYVGTRTVSKDGKKVKENYNYGVYIVNNKTGEAMSLADFKDKYKGNKAFSRIGNNPNVAALNWATDNGYRWIKIEEKSQGQSRYGGENRSYYNYGINGTGAVSIFAMRPGWHAGSLPTMRQIGKGKDRNLRDDNFVWVEGEIPADIDYNEEAQKNADKDIPDHIPTDGYYLKATNANKEASQADKVGWYVAGAFKPNRIMSDKETRDIIDQWNNEHPSEKVEYDWKRESGKDFNAETMSLEDSPKFSLKVYHGSGADFSEFDFDHMGEGAGSQFFGWGGYVTSSEKIGKDYATLMDNDITQRGRIIEHRNAERLLAKYPTLDSFLKASEVVASKKTEEEKIAYYNKALKNAEPYHNLYEVNIPDDNGKNYLDWYAPATESLKQQAKDILKDGYPQPVKDSREYKDALKEYTETEGKSEADFEQEFLAAFNEEVDRAKSFGDIYDALSNNLSDKATSKLLSSLGYTGIKYPAGTIMGGTEEGDTNYVIFKPEDMQIAEHTKFSIKTFHGSQADFDHFDHSFMGSGEGSQAYGWGTYVSEVQGIAKAYAKQNAAKHSANNEYVFKAKQEFEDAKSFYDKAFDAHNMQTSKVSELMERKKLYEESLLNARERLEAAKASDNKFKERRFTGNVSALEANIKSVESKISEEEENLKEKEKALADAKAIYQKAKDYLDSLKPERNLYTVDIPDDTGDNYLGWDDKLSDKAVSRIGDALNKKGVEGDVTTGGLSYGDYVKKNKGNWTGSLLYRNMAATLGGQKEASMLLKDAGFDGVKVIAQRNTGGNKEGKMNYVIFDENNAKITNHTKFSLKSKPVRFEVGKSLSEDEKKEVLSTLKDAYKVNGVPYHLEETAGGKEKRVYEPTADDYMVSDITNRPLRYYITLPDGRVAHPTEVYPNISDHEVKSSAEKQGFADSEAEEMANKAISKIYDAKVDAKKALAILNAMQELQHDTRDVGYGMNNAQSYNYKTGIFTSDAAQAIDYVVRRMRRKEEVSDDVVKAVKKAVADNFGMVDNLINGMSEIKKGTAETTDSKYSLKHGIKQEMKHRVQNWLSSENLNWAEGKTREEIFNHFGNELKPIAIVPVGYMKYFDGVSSNAVFSGMGYFVDHAINHHPEEAADEYNKIQDVLDFPDDVKLDERNKKRPSLIFIKKYDKYNVEVVSADSSDSDKLVFHKSFYHKRNMPHKNMSSVAIEKPSMDEITIISPSNNEAASLDFSALDGSSVAKIDNSSETSKENGEKVDGNAPKTFDEFLKSPSMKFSIKNDEQRKAAQNAYDYAVNLRPDRHAQYALVDMARPETPPEYYEKKVLANRWKSFYNKKVKNDWGKIVGKPYGNYKLFDLDRPFEEQVNKVDGNVPDNFEAPVSEPNKNDDNESGAEYRNSSQQWVPSSVSYQDRYEAFKRRIGLGKLKNQVEIAENAYKAKQKERSDYHNQLMKEYMDKHGLSSQFDIPGDVWQDLREKSFEKYQDELDELFHKYVALDKQLKDAKQGTRFSLKDEKESIVEDAKKNGTYMLAPNGKKTKLNAEQWVNVRTANFKKWFGDWESDTENASKVVDENGEPMVVYHGRSTDFNTFERKTGQRGNIGISIDVKAEGFFFSPNKDFADEFASNAVRHRGGKANIVPCFLNIRKPLDLVVDDYDKRYEDVTGWSWIVGMDRQDNLWEIMDEEGMADKIKEKGYDGAIFVEEVDDNYEPTQISYCALDANQIKSADNNNGDYSVENNDIRFSLKSMEDKPEGWKQANKKAIHIAEAIERNPKFSLKKLDGTLIKAGTYFSGGGLVEEGLKGIIDPVVAVEYDEKISGVYRNNFGQHLVTADVRDVDPKELVKSIDGDVEYFHASPVCKNYSKAKANHEEVELDKETAQSTADFINQVKPKVVTIENVKGYRDSEAMKIITDALNKNGYKWDADVYNAADYGGYTNRERLIVRAVKDGELPEKPKKMARKKGWYEAVEDIMPTLIVKKNGVAPWMDIRLKADGIDWRNIDKPLYVMGSAYADGKVPHAFADELLPTLRTKSGDVIVMPDGKVYRANGRVLARVSGVSDDYKMPYSEALSHTIIGNGIPTQLTEHVIAPLIKGTLKPTSPEDAGNTKFSLRVDQFEHDLEQWKKDNNLPKDAVRPSIPIREPNESAADFLKRVKEYRKQMALWKTAPQYEGHLLSDDTAQGQFNLELQKGSVLARIALQDSMLPIRKAQEAIMKEAGVDRLNIAEDAYTAENRSHGKGKNEFEEYNDEFLQPLRKAYNKMMKNLGKSYDNVKVYMMAKHGLERNAHIAFKKSLDADYEKQEERIKAYQAYKSDIDRLNNDADFESGKIDFTTWRQKDNAIRLKYAPSYLDYRYDKMGITQDYSGLSALFDGSDFEEAAADLVKDVESNHPADAQELWNATNAATKKILRDSYKADMMSKDVYEYVRGMYQNYIPLRGWGDTNADQVWNYMGGGKGAFNQILKKANGRGSLADDPIAYIENMAESGILINNKNWVKRHLLLLAENHPTSLLNVSKAWYIKTTDANGNEEWIPASPQITANMTARQVDAAIDAFQKKMEAMEQKGDATQKREHLEISYPQTNSEEREHEVRVMKDGEEYVIYVNGDPQLAQAMNNTRAHRVRQGMEENVILRNIEKLGRKMAAAYTSLSPLFIPSNFFRDTTMTLASTAIREDARYNYLLRKNMLTHWNTYGMVRSYQNGTLREKVRNGEASKTERMFYDFMMNGGETGFVSSLDVEDLKKKFKNELKDMNRMALNPKKVGRFIMDEIETLNRAIEDSNRFVVYMTSIQYGRSIDEAVNDAKDVTLNFNRKGTGEHGWQWVRSAYLFINPAIQSLQTLGALAKHHPFKFTAVTTAWLVSGMLAPMVNQALMSIFGGDDDKDKYWSFTKWDRRNNFILWAPGTHEFIKIPLAQEFRGFYGVGDMIASKLLGGDKAQESWEDYGWDLLGQVIDMLPLDPTSYDGNIAIGLMPNAIRPIYELAFNVDFTGKPLFKDSEYNKYDPNFTKAYAGTPDWLVRISRMVNSVGNDYPDFQQNAFDKFGDPRFNLNNPAVADHVLSSYLGGAYTMGSQILGVATKALNGDSIKMADVPLLSKFVSNPDDRPVSKKQGDEFWTTKERHDRAANTLSKLKKKAKVDGDYSTLDVFFNSDEYEQYKKDDKVVKKYEEDKKKERAEESGDEYKPHKTTYSDIYKAHATPKDDFEDLKLSQLYNKVKAYASTWNAMLGMASSQADDYYEKNAFAIQAAESAKDIIDQMNDIKKGFLSDEGKDAWNAEDMGAVRELRKQAIPILEKANKVLVARQKAKAEKK